MPAEAQQSRPHHEATWSEVIRVVESSGGSVERTPSGFALVRTVGTMLLHFALPRAFNPDRPDDGLPPSPNTLHSIQRNLDVKLPYYYVL